MFKKGDKVEVYRNQYNVLYYSNIYKGFKGTINEVVHSVEVGVGSYARVTGFTGNDGLTMITTYIKLPYLKKVK